MGFGVSGLGLRPGVYCRGLNVPLRGPGSDFTLMLYLGISARVPCGFAEGFLQGCVWRVPKRALCLKLAAAGWFRGLGCKGIGFWV